MFVVCNKFNLLLFVILIMIIFIYLLFFYEWIFKGNLLVCIINLKVVYFGFKLKMIKDYIIKKILLRKIKILYIFFYFRDIVFNYICYII